MNQITNSNRISLDIENTEDDFEEFTEDNWIPSLPQGKELWDENWDELNEIDDDLAKFLNVNSSTENPDTQT